VTLRVGHRIDPRWGGPVALRGTVTWLGEGRFRYTGGIWEGQEGHMGASAVVQSGPVRVLITTHATYDWADEQLRSAGLAARAAKFVVVENPKNHPRGFAGVYPEGDLLGTPGPPPLETT